jgi:thiol-disulfide isomerase/thioredoxin
MVGIGLGLLALAARMWIGNLASSLAATEPASQVSLGPETNKPAADFTLTNLKGESVRLSSLQGHPVLLNFWATWCGPCQLEMPLFERYFEKYAPDLVVLAVNAGEASDEVQQFVDELGLKFTVLLDQDEEVTDQYLIQAFPTSFFIDRQGVVRYRHIGSLDEDQLAAYLKELGVEK